MPQRDEPLIDFARDLIQQQDEDQKRQALEDFDALPPPLQLDALRYLVKLLARRHTEDDA